MKQIAFRLLLAFVAATGVQAQEKPVPAAPAAVDVLLPTTDVEKLTAQVNELLDQLAVARAQRGDCEATLAPLEARARQTDSQQRWAEQKTAMEKVRPGYDCNPRTLICTKKV